MDIIQFLITSLRNNIEIKTFKIMMEVHHLHTACENGHLPIVEYLIQKQNCNKESKNNYGYTPLEIARLFNQNDIVQYLCST